MSLKGISNLLKIPWKEAAKLGLSWGHGSSLSVHFPSFKLEQWELWSPAACMFLHGEQRAEWENLGVKTKMHLDVF